MSKKELVSSTFSVDDNWTLGWYLKLYPDGETEEHEGFISIYLTPTEASKSVSTKYHISILDENNKKYQTASYERVFTECLGFGSPKFIKCNTVLDPKNGLLPNNTLTILCELEAAEVSEVKTTLFFSKKEKEKSIAKCLKDFRRDILELYSSKRFADVMIKVGDAEYKAHKNILSARSPVFAAMFEHNMEETITSIVEIKDVEPGVMGEVLSYLYSGELKKKEIAAEILPVSDKYDLKGLKELCEKILEEQLTVQNALSTLILADLHYCQLLKASTIQFIKTNVNEVIKTRGWSKLSSHLNLVMEICKEILDSCLTLDSKR